MAASPQFKVYSADGQYVASCKYAEDAGAVVANYMGGTVRFGHRRVVWREGREEDTAANSYDAVAQTIHARLT
jgi:hypothetical protein